MGKKKEGIQLAIRRLFLIVLDILSVISSGVLALMLRFDMRFSAVEAPFMDIMWSSLPVIVVLTLALFAVLRLYNSLWTYASMVEFERIVIAAACSSGMYFLFIFISKQYLPRSFYFLYPFCLSAFLFITRFGYRAVRSLARKVRDKGDGNNVMIIGSGEAGNMIIREMTANENLRKHICCVIDDDTMKIGSYIQGVKIVGDTSSIAENVEKYNISEIIIAMPSASRARISEIINACKETGCSLKTLPGICELVNGNASVGQLRNVEVEDLLGREPIKVDMESIMNYVVGKTVMVTGGGGSIGSELCRQLAGHGVGRLIIFDIYENNAYDIQQELIRKYPELDLVVLIGSVRNEKRLEKVFEMYRPDIVYHAAAHKHVPLMEVSPNEAIKNNVFGTYNTVRMADKYGVSRFVLISTDKAVNPTNVMGATKRICEMIVQSYNKKSKTDYVAVRFGNVLGSNGSVIPLFKKQIEAGGPVTVTHPDIIRYFMTISEAVSLVLQAGAYAKGGEIFVLDMGQPMKILELAENMIRLSGHIPYEDIDIEFTGLRPGEKLFEEMLMSEEGLKQTENKLIHIGSPIEMDDESFWKNLETLYTDAMEEPTVKEVKKWVKKLVPTYTEKKGEN